MYELNYVELEEYRREFNCQLNIIAGDTDSFFIECQGVNLREQLLLAMIRDEQLDTSNYDKMDPLYSERYAAVIGKYKDESKGQIRYKEAIFLRPKSYALKTEKKTVLKCKGINIKQTDIQFDNYVNAYETGCAMTVDQECIGTKNHQLMTINSKKWALDPFDNKRQWTMKNTSVAYDHYSLL